MTALPALTLGAALDSISDQTDPKLNVRHEHNGDSGVADPFHPLDPRYIPAQRIGGLIFAAVVAFFGLIGFGIRFFFGDFDWLFISLTAGGLLITAGLFVLAVAWPPISYRYIRWRLSDTGFEIHRGVLWRHRITVPTARVQHADVSQGPLQRSFDLGTLTIHTAGTQNSSVELDGLQHGTALALRDEIIRQREATDVV